MKRFLRLSTIIFFAGSLIVTATAGPNGHIRFINTASALARTYDIITTVCYDADGDPIAYGTACIAGKSTKCTPIACDAGN